MDKVKKITKNTKLSPKSNSKKNVKKGDTNTESSKKIAKSKANKKAKLMIVPRLRLEPRLTSKRINKNGENQCKTESKVNSGKNFHAITLLTKNNFEQKSEAHTLNNSSAIKTKNNINTPSEDVHSSNYDINTPSYVHSFNYDINTPSYVHSSNYDINTPSEDVHSSNYDIENDNDLEHFTVKRQRRVRNSNYWNDKELMNLADGLQSEGFSNFKKVAEYVKTKNEEAINHYVKRRRLEARSSKNSNRGRPVNMWTTVSKENLASWPNSRKWRKVAYNQMLSHVRYKEYSEHVIPALCKKFYEDEKEPTDPQVINVKLIYKYIINCMSGDIPPQLPPKESLLVQDLLREVRSMPIAYDFEEELKFVNGFKEATKFKPFHVKDEFMKKFKKFEEEDTSCPNAVPVPEKVFMDLSRHKKIVQSFNPMIAPVWMLQKEQEILEKHSEESRILKVVSLENVNGSQNFDG